MYAQRVSQIQVLFVCAHLNQTSASATAALRRCPCTESGASASGHDQDPRGLGMAMAWSGGGTRPRDSELLGAPGVSPPLPLAIPVCYRHMPLRQKRDGL